MVLALLVAIRIRILHKADQYSEITLTKALPMKPVGLISTGVLLLFLATVTTAYAQQEKHERDGKPPKQELEAKDQQQPAKKQQDREQQAKDQQPQQKAADQQEPRQEKTAQVRQDKSPEKQQPAKSPSNGQNAQNQRSKQDADQQGRQQVTGPQMQREATSQQDHQQQQIRSVQKQQSQQQTKNAQPQQQPQPKGLQKQQANRQPPQKVEPVQQREQHVVWQQHRAHSWQAEHRTWQQRGGYEGYRIPDDRFIGYFGRERWFRVNSLSLQIFGGYPRFQYSGFWFSVLDPWPEYWETNWYENDDMYIDYSEDGYYLYNRRYPRDRIAVTVYVN
jgi:hypothetical protein